MAVASESHNRARVIAGSAVIFETRAGFSFWWRLFFWWKGDLLSHAEHFLSYGHHLGPPNVYSIPFFVYTVFFLFYKSPQ